MKESRCTLLSQVSVINIRLKLSDFSIESSESLLFIIERALKYRIVIFLKYLYSQLLDLGKFSVEDGISFLHKLLLFSNRAGVHALYIYSPLVFHLDFFDRLL